MHLQHHFRPILSHPRNESNKLYRISKSLFIPQKNPFARQRLASPLWNGLMSLASNQRAGLPTPTILFPTFEIIPAQQQGMSKVSLGFSEIRKLPHDFAQHGDRLVRLAKFPFCVGQACFQFTMFRRNLQSLDEGIRRLAKRMHSLQRVPLGQPSGRRIPLKLNRTISSTECLIKTAQTNQCIRLVYPRFREIWILSCCDPVIV